MDKFQAAAIAATSCTLCAGGGYVVHYATSTNKTQEEFKKPLAETPKPIVVFTEKGCTLFFFKFCDNIPSTKPSPAGK